jgi:hypothetical protein
MVEEIFQSLRGRLLVKTRPEFCEEWLGRSRNYLNVVAEPSDVVLVYLARKLRAYHQRDLLRRVVQRLVERLET